MNGVVGGVEGVRRGVHVCRGNWSRREDVHLQGDYAPMLPFLVQMDVDQLVLELATPRAGEIEVFKEYGNEKELGVGVVNPRSDTVEDPTAIVARVEQMLEYFDPDKIFLNPDCGFGTFAERSLNPPAVASAKLQSISTAAAVLRARHGG
jgi:5-methyltetrahydropteroyltriglutamate--homocysteine methyltransferase